MTKKLPSKKEQKPAESEPPSHRKKLGFRTPDRFKRLVFRRQTVILSQRPRSFGGHR